MQNSANDIRGVSAYCHCPLLLVLGSDVAAVLHALEVARVIQVDQDRIVFDKARLLDLTDDLILLHRALLFKRLTDHIPHHTRRVAPLGECIEPTANKNKTRVFDKLVVRRRDVRLLREEGANRL